MDDEHACRVERKSYAGELSFRIVCRCGYAGSWRYTRDEAMRDRLRHKNSVDVPIWPKRD